MTRKIPLAAYAELCAAAIIAGSSVVAGKATTLRLPLFLSQTACLAVALLLLIPLTLRSHKGRWKVGTRDMLLLLAQAFFGMFLFRVFMLYGLRFASAAEGGIMTSLTPFAVAFLSCILLREKMTWRTGGGILCSLAGIAAIQVPSLLMPGTADRPASVIGMLLLSAAVAGEAALTVLRKMLSPRISSLLGTAYVTAFAFLMFLACSVIELLQSGFPEMGAADAGIILYYGIFVTALAYVLWFRGVAKVPAGTAGVFTGCIPVSALWLSHLCLGEPMSLRYLAGTALVFAGILLVSGASARRNESRVLRSAR
ncbi:DMT family transporter [Paenibacillus sp. 7124]|uniref:DMT family transporter n=1 Tax=Paenibacillus apii TaxID=1850370 RepID=A0A6M1PG86_9BACL|nr:DMT family transporter [Paenibacillus apii]NGM82196.1 DMT family transporter [Paenibacillus apii]NJJ39333.1 DMT family transporter [Paenibacillus apii]